MVEIVTIDHRAGRLSTRRVWWSAHRSRFGSRYGNYGPPTPPGPAIRAQV